MLIDPNLIVFYVDNPLISANFYANLLDIQPIESAPTFAMFQLKSGLRLGLWSKHAVGPMVATFGNGGELVFQVTENQEINELFITWQQKEIPFIQPPTLMDFGYTFVALDPDGHRLRVYSLNQS